MQFDTTYAVLLTINESKFNPNEANDIINAINLQSINITETQRLY